MNKEPIDLTLMEVCKYISIINKLCETGIMTFDLEKCKATVQVDTLTEYLEKQNLDLQQRIDEAIKLIEEIQNFPHTNINQHKDLRKLKEILRGKDENN